MNISNTREINRDIVNNFINFFYGNLNNKNIDELKNLFNIYSQMIFQGKFYKGSDNIISLLLNNISQKIKYNVLSIDVINSGQKK